MSYSTTATLTPAQFEAFSSFCDQNGLEARLGKHPCPWHHERHGASLEIGLYEGRLRAHCWGKCNRREFLLDGDRDPSALRPAPGEAPPPPEPEPTNCKLRPALEVIRWASWSFSFGIDDGLACRGRCIDPLASARYWTFHVPADDAILVEHPDSDDRFARKVFVISDAWVIPISDEAGEIRGIKIHRENPGQFAKSGWVPIGINRMGQHTERHGWTTLWPPPEWLGKPELLTPNGNLSEAGFALVGTLPEEERSRMVREYALRRAELADAYARRADTPFEFLNRMACWKTARDWQAHDAPEDRCRDDADPPTLILAGGELKALAYLSAGLHAVAPTCGEGIKWTPGLIRRLAGWRLVVAMDDDEAGRKFVDATAQARARWGSPKTVEYFNHGKKPDGSKFDANDFPCSEALRMATLGLIERNGQQ